LKRVLIRGGRIEFTSPQRHATQEKRTLPYRLSVLGVISMALVLT
jgi:hypothetical protein